MADNWSASTVTLTDAGDWAKWSFDIPSGDVADFNGGLIHFALRAALSAASRSVILALVVNDTIWALVQASPVSGPPDQFISTSSWISANRFAGGLDTVVSGFAAAQFPYAGPSYTLANRAMTIADAAPFVVGTNEVRLLSFGRSFDGASEPIEIDFISIQSGDTTPPIEQPWTPVSYGTDSVANTKPATGGGVTGFDDHVDPDPVQTIGPHPTWILKAPDAATGTAAASLLEVEKFCPKSGGTVEAKVRVTGSGSPLSGLIGAYDEDTDTSQLDTLDGNGEATFTFPVSDTVAFWFGGSDDWAPTSFRVGADSRIGCSGWHVGRIGVGR